MPTDLDRDDEFGTRLRALHAWSPEVAPHNAWTSVERRRKRKQLQLGALTGGLVALALVASFAVATRGSKNAVRVVTPPTTTDTAPPTLPSASATPVTMPGFPNDASTQPVVPFDERLQVTPAGRYQAGDVVDVALRTDLAGDYYNEGSPRLCYAWNDGELCDPEVRALNTKEVNGVVHWGFEVPGWVFTPQGRQSCEVMRCRIEAGGPGRIGTDVLSIAAGPQPDDHARVVEARGDGTVVVDIDGLEPDPSWTAWAAGKSEERIRDHGALGIGVCVFRAALYCDGLVEGPTVPIDGGPHRIEIVTNRQQFTFGGWYDCVVEACVVAVSRTVGVTEGPDGSTGSYTESVAVLPYRLPADTPPMPVPRITLEQPGPFAQNETVSVTFHDLPANMGKFSLGQCAADNLGTIDDCRYRDSFASLDPTTRTTTFAITNCADERGCYLAIAGPAKGYDAIAKTERFAVTG